MREARGLAGARGTGTGRRARGSPGNGGRRRSRKRPGGKPPQEAEPPIGAGEQPHPGQDLVPEGDDRGGDLADRPGQVLLQEVVEGGRGVVDLGLRGPSHAGSFTGQLIGRGAHGEELVILGHPAFGEQRVDRAPGGFVEDAGQAGNVAARRGNDVPQDTIDGTELPGSVLDVDAELLPHLVDFRPVRKRPEQRLGGAGALGAGARAPRGDLRQRPKLPYALDLREAERREGREELFRFGRRHSQRERAGLPLRDQ